MKLEKVREIKAELLKASAMIEAIEADAVEGVFNTYADRLVSLMNKVERGSDFCISFIPEGETERVNVLPPTPEAGVDVLRDLALSAITTRLRRRAEKDNQTIAVVVERVPTKED